MFTKWREKPRNRETEDLEWGSTDRSSAKAKTMTVWDEA